MIDATRAPAPPGAPSFPGRPAAFSVLHVLPSLDPRRGGPVTAVAELAAGLLEAGVPCAIAAPRAEVGGAGGGRVLPCPWVATPLGPWLALPRRLPLPGPTVLHVHGLGALTPWSAVLRRRPGPVVATLHGALDWRRRAPLRGPRRLWHERVDLPLLDRLAAVHATRTSEVEALREVRPGARVAELPWTLRDAPPRPRGRGERPFLLAVGRLHPIKGLDRLLAAMAAGAMTGDRRRLLLAGTGPSEVREDLARRARALGLRDRVEFLGLLPPPVLRDLLAQADALVLASRYENFGMVVLEALREGCPVVASRETPWEVLATEGAGVVANFEAPAAAAAVLAATASASWRARTGTAGRALFEGRYTPRHVVPRFLAWYADAVRAAAGREGR